MGFINKDRTVSGGTILKESVAFENVNFIKNEYDMISDDPQAVPSQQSVVDYVKSYVTAPRIEGNQKNPTNLYIAFLLDEAGIRIRQGMSIIYFYVVNGVRRDSKSLKLVDDYAFEIETTYDRVTADDRGITNYMNQTDAEAQAANSFSTDSGMYWVTSSGSFTGTPFTRTDTSMIIDDADVNEYVAKRIEGGLEIGATYTATFTISNSNGNDVKVAIGSDIFSHTNMNIDTNGTYTLNFQASTTALIFMIFGTGGTVCTMTDLGITRDLTTSITTAYVTFPIPAKFKYDVTHRFNAIGGTGTVTIDSSLGTTERQYTQVLDKSSIPLVFTFSRTAKGLSTVKIVLTAEYEEDITNSDGDEVILTGEVEHTFVIRVEES